MARKRSRRKGQRTKTEPSVPTQSPTRRSRKLWVAVATGAGAAGMVTLWVWTRPAPVVPPPSGEVFPVAVDVPRTAPAESLFANVDPGRDRWVSEVVHEELEETLQAMADALVRGDSDAFLEGMGEEFRSVSLEPASSAELDADGGPRITKTFFEEQPSLDRASFAAAVKPWLGEFAAVDYAKFKIVAVDLESDDAARTGIVFELKGRTGGGELVARRYHGRLSWVHEADGWKISELALERGTESRAPAPLFVDASASAFAGVESYARQMALGVNDYRTRLDAASGIDVFAHNGVSVGDVDGDGFEDLFVAQPAGLPNRLYRNEGDGTFEDVSRDAGVDVLDRTSMGLLADFDNDGDQDLALILQNEVPVLFTNDGRGRFARSTAARFERKDGARVTYGSAAAADYDGDGFLDLYVCAYLTIEAPGADKGLPLPYPYHDAANGAANVLYRNLGDGRFEDVTAAAGLERGNDRFSFAAAWGDYNGDGRPDLYVANDFGRNNLYRNDGGGRFEDVSAEAGVEDLGAGMSAAWGDYDHDGRDDLYVGNMWSSAGQRLTRQADYRDPALRDSYARHAKGNSLFRNRGDGGFDDVSTAAGVELGRWAWSSDFFDADNDGDDDLYVTNGYVTNRSDRDL